MIPRRVSKQLKIGDVTIGGGAPIRVQSMTTAFTRDVEATVAEILRLAEAGCEIVRVAVPHKEDADALPEIRKRSPIPVIADIHFDYRLALTRLGSRCGRAALESRQHRQQREDAHGGERGQGPPGADAHWCQRRVVGIAAHT